MINDDSWNDWEIKPPEKRWIHYLSLPLQEVRIDEAETVFLRCQLGPCLREEALRESFLIKWDKAKNTVKIKNIAEDKLTIRLYICFIDQETTASRNIDCEIGDKIRCEGASYEIAKTKSGFTIIPNINEGTCNIQRSLNAGEACELLNGDMIVIGGRSVAELRSFYSDDWN